MNKPIPYTVPLRNGRYLAQLVLPDNLSKAEADRLCALINALAKPYPIGYKE